MIFIHLRQCLSLATVATGHASDFHSESFVYGIIAFPQFLQIQVDNLIVVMQLNTAVKLTVHARLSIVVNSFIAFMMCIPSCHIIFIHICVK